MLDLSLLVLRVVIAAVIFPHGAQKLWGWFGGFGFEGTMQYFTQQVHVPYVIGVLVILGESLGMIALALGLFGRYMAASLIIIMGGALYFEHLQHGFFMNWFGIQKGEGIEFDLLVFGAGFVLVILGSGAYSIDYWLSTYFKRRSLVPQS
jgi:putative oxidoreductase